MKAICFQSTAVAADAIQYGTANIGDILVVEQEQVVGVASIFPFAVTEMRGDLSEFLVDQPTNAREFVELVMSIRAAVAEAKRRGYTVIPEFIDFCS